MLVHICCSVDSFYFICRLKKDYPDEKIIGYFYDPNIHPKSEYDLRCLEARRSCEILGAEFIEGDYDDKNWFAGVKGYESEPENSKRCELCFDIRLLRSACLTKDLKEKIFTTTLLMSPKKNLKKLEKSAKKAEEISGASFIFLDYRKNGGTQEQFLMAKQMQTYRQNYCGCMFALNDQRQRQKRPSEELFCNIYKKVLPCSIDERLELFKKRRELELSGEICQIKKQNFLNYRQLFARLSLDGKTIPSYFLWYSHSNQKKFKVSPADKEKAFFFTPRDLGLKSLQDLKKLTIKEEMLLREKLGFFNFDMSVLIVTQKIENEKYLVELNSQIYQDLRFFLDLERDKYLF